MLSERRRHRDRHFDAHPLPSARLADLQVGRFQDEYLPAAIDPETLAANDRTPEERLAAAKMIASADHPVPTVAGMLVLGKHPLDHLPGAYVQFLRIAGTNWGGDVLDEARCVGPITDLVRRVDDKLIAHNRTTVGFLSTPGETRVALSDGGPAATRPQRRDAPHLRRHQCPCKSIGSTTVSRLGVPADHTGA